MNAVKPYLVVGVPEDFGLESTPPYLAVLDWLRSEGIDPDSGNRCEVYEGGDKPYAKVTVFTLDADGERVVDAAREEFVTHVETVALSSLPPVRDE
ncbi:hypothetical protein AB0F88_40015 [Streptosporangium sp. NPDC023963]|uniref:hypothetical protein n=1 Tax=Streptosporangium sp. NPDC023963 TaxID=3155608 RepID=UPI00341ABC28